MLYQQKPEDCIPSGTERNIPIPAEVFPSELLAVCVDTEGEARVTLSKSVFFNTLHCPDRRLYWWLAAGLRDGEPNISFLFQTSRSEENSQLLVTTAWVAPESWCHLVKKGEKVEYTDILYGGGRRLGVIIRDRDSYFVTSADSKLTSIALGEVLKIAFGGSAVGTRIETVPEAFTVKESIPKPVVFACARKAPVPTQGGYWTEQ